MTLPEGSKILVTGASGFTGSLLVRKLCEAGHSVRAIARDSSNLEHLKDLPIDWFRGNVYHKETVEAAAKDIEYVFHVAALFRSAKDDDEEYRLVHLESTKLLAGAVLHNPSFKRFIHVSTMGIHGHIPNPPGNEESPYAPGDVYQETKLEAELWIRKFSKDHGLPLTVIRPCGIYGPGDMRLLKIFKMVKWPVFPILGFGKCLYHLVHVEDLTDAMILSASHEKALGEYFLVGAESHIRLQDIASIVAKELSKRLFVLKIPVLPFFILADITEALCKPLGIEPLIYRRRVAFYTKDRSFDVSKIKNTIGFSPAHTNEKGIKETTQWYKKNNYL
jgi:dihydroflavonol-4-reductase